MSSFPSRLIGLATLFVATLTWAAPADYAGIGRTATPAEVKAWDIDVRPDFKGLPPGSGTVTQGQDVWEAKCSSCHGVFGESNETFSPLIGGTTAEDVKTGHVARLNDNAFPARTTFMKVATLSSVWDYINRAMPWNAPKSLTHDEVYAVTAYMLNLANVVPADFTLSDRTMAEAQARLPNRNGMTTDHGMWPGRGMGNGGKPDVKAVACMTNCAAEASIRSSLPEHARNAHGNLAAQNRLVGAELGADTAQAPGASPRAAAAAAAIEAAAAQQPGSGSATPLALLKQNQCLSCHAVDRKIIGPALRDVAAKHKDQADLVGYLQTRIKQGGRGVWGPIPMPPQAISADDTKTLARWLAAGAPKQ